MSLFSDVIFVPAKMVERNGFDCIVSPKDYVGGGDAWYVTYTYQGYDLKYYVTKNEHDSTGMMPKYVNGTNTPNVMGAVSQLFIASASSAFTGFNIFTTAVSVLTKLSQTYPSFTVHAVSGSYAQLNYIFTKYTKKTYINDGSTWVYACKTYAISSEGTDNYAYDGTTGVGKTVHETMSGRFDGPGYQYPAPVAVGVIQNPPYAVMGFGNVRVKVYNTIYTIVVN